MILCENDSNCGSDEYCNIGICMTKDNCVKNTNTQKCQQNPYTLLSYLAETSQFENIVKEQCSDINSLNNFQNCVYDVCTKNKNYFKADCEWIKKLDIKPMCSIPNNSDCYETSDQSTQMCDHDNSLLCFEKQNFCNANNQTDNKGNICSTYCNKLIPSPKSDNSKFSFVCDINSVNCEKSDDCYSIQGIDKNEIYCNKSINQCNNFKQCSTDQDCELNTHICSFGQCINKKECSDDLDCQEFDNMLCNKENNFCMLKKECSDNSDCGNGLNCGPNGYCINTVKCENDEECECGQSCSGGICVTNKKCKIDSDCTDTINRNCINGLCLQNNCMCENSINNCRSGQVCKDGNCYDCLVNGDCDKGYICLENKCIKEEKNDNKKYLLFSIGFMIFLLIVICLYFYLDY